MRVLLVSTYELGHQPLHVASPATALASRGHDVRCLDLSVQAWDESLADWADAICFSVPMHTAMRIAARAMRALKARRPRLPIACYGLYAPIAGDAVVSGLADVAIAGEYEPGLIEWVDELEAGTAGCDAGADPVRISLRRSPFQLPARHLLPPLSRYAHLRLAGEERQVGAVESSHGCSHRCRHCPVPAVYGGRTRPIDSELVAADIDQLVAMGARHITFADPDFLNRPRHALQVVGRLQDRHPGLTFDCTVKVEHILRHCLIWPDLGSAGCLFVVTAIESVDDRTLERLDKGHTRADAEEAVRLLRRYGIEPRPSFLPFTPWTTLQDVLDLLDFVLDLDLVGNVDPVQYGIRLLVPHGSLLLGRRDLRLGPYDPDALVHPWSSPDPRVDLLQNDIAALVATAAMEDRAIPETYLQVRRLTLDALDDGRSRRLNRADHGSDHRGHDGVCGDPALERAIPVGATEGRPRLTEPWFC